MKQKQVFKITLLFTAIIVLFFVLVPTKDIKAIRCCICQHPTGEVASCPEFKNVSLCSEFNRGDIICSGPYPDCEERPSCSEWFKPLERKKPEKEPEKERPFVPPELQITIPGLVFTKEEAKLKICTECVGDAPECTEQAEICPKEKGCKCKNWVYQIPWIGEYLLAVYKWAVGTLAILAVVMIMISGVHWILAGGAPEKITSAKQGITGAIIGLVLILLMHQILSIIDPRLTVFKPITIGIIRKVDEIENEPIDVLGVVDVCSGSTTYDTKDLCEATEAKCPEAGFPCTQSTATNKWCCLGGCQEVVTKPNVTIVKNNDKIGLQNGGLIKRDNAPWCYDGNCKQAPPSDGNANIQISSSICQVLLSLSALNIPIKVTSIVGSHSKCTGKCGSPRCDSPSFANCSARPSPHWRGRGFDLGTAKLTKQQIEKIGDLLIPRSDVTQVIYCYPEATGKISCETSKCTTDGCYKTCTPIIIKGHQSGKGLMCGHADHIHVTVQ